MTRRQRIRAWLRRRTMEDVWYYAFCASWVYFDITKIVVAG